MTAVLFGFGKREKLWAAVSVNVAVWEKSSSRMGNYSFDGSCNGFICNQFVHI